MSWNLGPIASINPDGSNAPMCQAPGCYRRATKRSRDIPELTWCDDDAGPLDPEIVERSAFATLIAETEQTLTFASLGALAPVVMTKAEQRAVLDARMEIATVQAKAGHDRAKEATEHAGRILRQIRSGVGRYNRGGYRGPAESSQPPPPPVAWYER